MAFVLLLFVPHLSFYLESQEVCTSLLWHFLGFFTYIHVSSICFDVDRSKAAFLLYFHFVPTSSYDKQSFCHYMSSNHIQFLGRTWLSFTRHFIESYISKYTV